MKRLMLCLSLLAAHVCARADASSEPDRGEPSRYTLKQASAEPAAQRSSRYSIRARFAAAESAGDLHQGANFTLIGKFAVAGTTSCSASALFSNGFE